MIGTCPNHHTWVSSSKYSGTRSNGQQAPLCLNTMTVHCHLLPPGSERPERLPLGGVPETPKRPSRKPAATLRIWSGNGVRSLNVFSLWTDGEHQCAVCRKEDERLNFSRGDFPSNDPNRNEMMSFTPSKQRIRPWTEIARNVEAFRPRFFAHGRCPHSHQPFEVENQN